MPELSALLADVGGTHARFAGLWSDGCIDAPTVLLTARFSSFEAALEHYCETQRIEQAPALAIAAAGPVDATGINVTNCEWHLRLDTLREIAAGGEVHLVNDFTAVALALPSLASSDLLTIGTGTPREGAPLAVLGAGTGLGVAGLVRDADARYVAVSGEGGHRTLAATTAREWAIVCSLQARYGHASAERILSGAGLVYLYETLLALDRRRAMSRPDAKIIAAAAFAGTDTAACEAVELFTGWLGAVAGDLALTFGAGGGVYIAGGIVPRWGQAFDGALFRRRFETKGRFRGMLREIPTAIIRAPVPALRGLATLVRR